MDEYISREAAISHPFANGQYDREHASKDFIMGYESYKEWLEALPAADVKPVVKGEWIKCGRDARPLCSKCGYEPLEITREYIVDGKLHSWDGAYNLSNFCPNCGADMRKEVNDER